MISGENPWYAIKDGDPRGRSMVDRHYSAIASIKGRKSRLFIGPGEKMVLMTNDSRALFGWVRMLVERADKQEGVNCTVFRNEGDMLSSWLITMASEYAWTRWPNQRLFTYVNPKKVDSVNPGFCFKKAGWTTTGKSKKSGLVLLERQSSWPG